jgi:hypothetical protein
MVKEGNTLVESGRTYVSAEPCHWGMIEMPPPPRRDWLEGLRSYQKTFEAHTWPNVRIDA